MSGSDYIDLCVHRWSPEMLFEEPPNGDDGAWCIASVCVFCKATKALEMGLGKFVKEYSRNMNKEK